jgi:hypothetical protein
VRGSSCTRHVGTPSAEGLLYTVRIVPECLSNRRNRVPPLPPPPPKASVSLPLGPKGVGEQHSFAGEGLGGPNSADWIESLALCILSDPLYHLLGVCVCVYQLTGTGRGACWRGSVTV